RLSPFFIVVIDVVCQLIRLYPTSFYFECAFSFSRSCHNSLQKSKLANQVLCYNITLGLVDVCALGC
ncbi:hypothetical protein MD535_21420, partial [Vibrio sp. ZSDZ65]